MTRFLILAHGGGDRWCDDAGQPFLGLPKQLAMLEGEVILHRIVRQLRDRSCDDIVIVAPDDRFDVDGSRRVSYDPWPTGCNMDKFIGSHGAGLWGAERTTILWGDCWYSDDAMNRIVACSGSTVHYFRRTGPSEVTGAPWDESFAVSWPSAADDTVLAAAWRVAFLWLRRTLHDCHVRTHYAAVLGFPDHQLDSVAALIDTPGQTVIDDWTDDIDTPAEYESWTRRRAEAAG